MEVSAYAVLFSVEPVEVGSERHCGLDRKQSVDERQVLIAYFKSLLSSGLGVKGRKALTRSRGVRSDTVTRARPQNLLGRTTPLVGMSDGGIGLVLVESLGRNHRPVHDRKHFLQQDFVVPLALNSPEHLLRGQLGRLQSGAIAVQVAEPARRRIVDGGLDGHDSTHEVEVLGLHLVLVRVVSGVVYKVLRACRKHLNFKL